MKMSQAKILIAICLLVLAANSSLAQEEQAVNDEDISVSSFEEMYYPALAHAAHREGAVVLQIKMDADGNVASARAISGSKMLIPDSLANVRKWRFHPNSSKTAVVIYEFHLVEGRCDGGRKGLFVLREPNIATITTCEMQPQP
jgi:TonB family protein